MRRYFVSQGEDKAGPFTVRQLKKLVRRGIVMHADLCEPEDGSGIFRAGALIGAPTSVEVVSEGEEGFRLVVGRGWMPGGDAMEYRGDTPLLQGSGWNKRMEGQGYHPAREGRGGVGSEKWERRGMGVGDRGGWDEGRKVDGDWDVGFREGAGTELDERGREMILHEAHPSLLSYPRRLFVVGCAAVAAIYLMPMGMFYLALATGIGAILLLSVLIERGSELYRVTDRRVERRYGIFATSSKEVRVRDIRSIDVKKRGLAGLFGVGDVEFSSAGGSEVEVCFARVMRAEGIKDLVREVQEG
jgi:hypothetical protein